LRLSILCPLCWCGAGRRTCGSSRYRDRMALGAFVGAIKIAARVSSGFLALHLEGGDAANSYCHRGVNDP
jgi:hypothetical protein